MKVRELADWIECYAPLSLQESYDNSGLNVGFSEAEITGVLLCVDVTREVIDEAEGRGANLIVSHHPLLFHPLRQLIDQGELQQIVRRSLQNGLSLYSAHTNLDSAPCGLSFRLGETLGLRDMDVLQPHVSVSGAGYGVVGDFRGSGLPLHSFLRNIQQTLHCGVIRHSALCVSAVQRVALCSGSGSFLIDRAIACGAQLFVSSDFKYNDFFKPDGRIVIADVGHYESENCAIDLLYDIITKKITNFAVYRSERGVNPVHYLC